MPDFDVVGLEGTNGSGVWGRNSFVRDDPFETFFLGGLGGPAIECLEDLTEKPCWRYMGSAVRRSFSELGPVMS